MAVPAARAFTSLSLLSSSQVSDKRDGIVVINAGGIILLANETVTRLFGCGCVLSHGLSRVPQLSAQRPSLVPLRPAPAPTRPLNVVRGRAGKARRLICFSLLTAGAETTLHTCSVRQRYPTESDLIGRNVSCLMPPPYSAQHSTYLKRFAATGKATILDRPQQLEGKSRRGKTFPIVLTVKRTEVDGMPAFMGAQDSPASPFGACRLSI